ncbi:hypothetical protein PAECIP111893_02463 [Paenibacillus plantiphilus]|uniref:Uncharacterized protein n=1 Tax=Paenibacillus plantiphilus TaxID=2905650 RepID=A0ABN8GGF5_9BACL|nr:hypothetical protein [Paenibacillus plantiphilus]CAH1206203.1 hypothetical protein PAECIP111893_02463 [Paenibacillus plantiphilus]
MKIQVQALSGKRGSASTKKQGKRQGRTAVRASKNKPAATRKGKMTTNRRRPRAAAARKQRRTAAGAYNQSFDQAYNEGYNAGFAKGFEDGHLLAYEGQP